jgi:hypothetical protein
MVFALDRIHAGRLVLDELPRGMNLNRLLLQDIGTSDLLDPRRRCDCHQTVFLPSLTIFVCGPFPVIQATVTATRLLSMRKAL